jgi:hypothetical protein
MDNVTAKRGPISASGRWPLRGAPDIALGQRTDLAEDFDEVPSAKPSSASGVSPASRDHACRQRRPPIVLRCCNPCTDFAALHGSESGTEPKISAAQELRQLTGVYRDVPNASMPSPGLARSCSISDQAQTSIAGGSTSAGARRTTNVRLTPNSPPARSPIPNPLVPVSCRRTQ